MELVKKKYKYMLGEIGGSANILFCKNDDIVVVS
jgi:hypothetical protein